MIPHVAVTTDASALRTYMLPDAISCMAIKSIDGQCTLDLEYPYNGENVDLLITGNIIYAKTSRTDSYDEPFKIVSVTQKIDGIITVSANHVTYDLCNYPVMAFGKKLMSPKEAISALLQNCVRNPQSDGFFVYASDDGDQVEFGIDKPVSLREAIFGTGGVVDVFGGVAITTGRQLIWKKESSIGTDKGHIQYGVNLQSYIRVVDVSDKYSHAYVFWTGLEKVTNEDGKTSTESVTVQVPDLVQLSSDTSDTRFQGSTIMNLSNDFKEKPTVDQLIARARQLGAQRGITSEKITLDISFVPLRLTEEYKDLRYIDEIGLHDTVTVDVPMYGTTCAKVIQTSYDVLRENYDQVSVGDAKGGIGKLISRLIL